MRVTVRQGYKGWFRVWVTVVIVGLEVSKGRPLNCDAWCCSPATLTKYGSPSQNEVKLNHELIRERKTVHGRKNIVFRCFPDFLACIIWLVCPWRMMQSSKRAVCGEPGVCGLLVLKYDT